MPPKKSGKQLTADQVVMLRRWIEQGGTWSTHWSFETPKKPALPSHKYAGWAVNEIDRFILARLEAEGLAPSPMAARTTLIRRVTLDLTGLPPTLREVDAFLADTSGEAYEKVVDRLLDSPRYGEQMARFGWTPPDMATPTSCTSTTIARPGPTVTGSSTPSI